MGQTLLITPVHASMSHAKQGVRRAHHGMLLWALIVGMSFPAVGLMSEGLPPLLLTAIRFAIAAVAIWPLVWRAPDRRPSLPGLALYAIMGLSLAGFFGTMFWAAHRTSALSMATLYVSVPMLAYYLGRLFGVEQRAVQLLGILILGAIGALGLAWAETGGQFGELQFGIAEAVFFVGCVASALYPVLSKFGLNRGWLSQRAEVRTFWSLLTGSVLVGLLGLIVEMSQQLVTMTLLDVLVLIYLGVFSSGMTFWLTQRATAMLTPAAVTAYSYLVPFASMVLLVIGQPHRMGWHWLPGSLLVVFAIALLLKRDAANRRPNQYTHSLLRRPAGQAADCFSGASQRALSINPSLLKGVQNHENHSFRRGRQRRSSSGRRGTVSWP